MFLKIIILVILSLNIGEAVDKGKHKSCSVLLNFYANGLKDLLLCSMRNSVPVKFCFKCKGYYQSVLEGYEAFLNGEDGNLKIKCYEKYVDQDRLNVVLRTHNYYENLWNDAHCSECFSGQNMTNSSDTTEMFKKLSILNTCISNFSITPCDNCSEYYNNANIFYNKLITKYKNQICFDIQDQMNRTRLYWSKTLKCYKREADILSFAALATTISCLPILFYSFFYFYTKHNERIHNRLYGNIESDSNEDSISSSSANGSNQSNIENVEEGAIGGGVDNSQNDVISTRETPEKIDDIEYMKSKNKTLEKCITDNVDTDDDEPIFSDIVINKKNYPKPSTSKKVMELDESEDRIDDAFNILDKNVEQNMISTTKAPEEIKHVKSKNKILKNNENVKVNKVDDPMFLKLKKNNLNDSTTKNLIEISTTEDKETNNMFLKENITDNISEDDDEPILSNKEDNFNKLLNISDTEANAAEKREIEKKERTETENLLDL